MAFPTTSNDGPSHHYHHEQSPSTSSSAGREQHSSYANDYYSSTQYLTHRHQKTAVKENDVGKSSFYQSSQSNAHNDDDKYGKKTSSAESEARKCLHRKTNVALMAFAFLSVGLIAWGYFLAFYTHPVQTIFRCDPQGCTYRETHDNGDHSVLHLHRHQIQRSELVRLDRRTRDVVEFLTGPRKGKSLYPSASRIVPDRKPSMFDPCPHTYVTYSLVFLDEEEHHMDLYHEYKQHSQEYLMVPHSKEPEDQTSTILFKHLDLTNAHLDNSHSQRTAFNQLKHYIAGKRTHVRLEELHYDGSLIGFKIISAGVVLICVTLIIWQLALFKIYQRSSGAKGTSKDMTIGDGSHEKEENGNESDLSNDSEDDTDSENEEDNAK